jgi:hypothetical protein
MAFDKQAQHVLDLIEEAGRPAFQTMMPPEARRVFRETRFPLQATAPKIASSTDRDIAGPGAGGSPSASIGRSRALPARRCRRWYTITAAAGRSAISIPTTSSAAPSPIAPAAP